MGTEGVSGMKDVDVLMESHLGWLAEQVRPGPLVVAYSGGMDSHVLLVWLARFVVLHPAYTLDAVHVHHGLNPKADAWAEHCLRICAGLGVPCHVERVGVTAARRESLEARAREARYQALARHLPSSGGTLLTAHHQDDQLETLLLALKRGAGVRGLAAMPSRQPFATGELVRPLLDCSRARLLEWAQQHQLRWIEDDSNQDERFDRNFLRAQILPRLQARWPSIGNTASRSAELCREQEALVTEVAELDMKASLQADDSLLLSQLAALSLPRRHNLLRYWLRMLSGAVPDRDAVLRIWSEVAMACQDANPQLKTECGVIRRYQGALHWLATPDERPADILALSYPGAWPISGRLLSLSLAATGADLRLPRADEPLSLRFAIRGGERAHPAGRCGSRTLKKLWQEYGIAPWRRDQIPMLFYGEQLAAAVGVFICQDFVAGAEAGLALHWAPE
jgi:tRNA(Ile)-lysidine synthase